MSDMTLKADHERQSWVRLSDIMWSVGYLIVTTLLVLLWQTFRREARGLIARCKGDEQSAQDSCARRPKGADDCMAEGDPGEGSLLPVNTRRSAFS